MNNKKILESMDQSDVIQNKEIKKRLVEVWEYLCGMERDHIKYINNSEFRLMHEGMAAAYLFSMDKLESKFPFLKSSEDREVIKNG